MIDIKKLKELSSDLSVLYVEDELSIQSKMSQYLKKFFFLVDVANNGLEGIEFFKQSKYDLVITDLSMPKMDGIDMIKSIKKINENQSILITTAYSQTNYLLSAITAHVDGFIIKPFDYDILNYELFKIVEKIKKFRENEDYKNYLQEMLIKQTNELNENYEKTLYSMIELIEQRDSYTAGHSKRVAYYCELIARHMKYSEEECSRIHQAGILHDIGKIETPDSVLLNPKILSDIEYKLMQEHVSVGYKLLNNIPMFKSLAGIVYAHHERYDGKGYPNGLKGDEVDEFARIMIVADAFDAMTTNRIYKSKKTVEEAIEELLLLSEKQFHPEVVKSAVVALKDMSIDDNINQLPQTKLEEERFAYFFRDTLSEAYNQNYLEVILMKNSDELVLRKMVIFSINNFSKYNKTHGWSKGDELLKEFISILLIYLKDELVFRVFGDDFVVMSKSEIDFNRVEKVLDKLMSKNSLSYKINKVDLSTEKIDKLSDIEMVYI